MFPASIEYWFITNDIIPQATIIVQVKGNNKKRYLIKLINQVKLFMEIMNITILFYFKIQYLLLKG